METVRGPAYIGVRVSARGGREAAVTARTRYGWVMIRKCGELPDGKMFPQ